MVSASDIKDEKTLWAWLEGRPKADAVAIAHRAALRVFPLWAGAGVQDWAEVTNINALPALWPTLLAGAFAIKATPDLLQIAQRAADFPAKHGLYEAVDNLQTPRRKTHENHPLDPLSASINALSASTYAAGGIPRTDLTTGAASDAVESVVGAAVTMSRVAGDEPIIAFDLLWKPTATDTTALEERGDCCGISLWPDAPPFWFKDAETTFLALWDRDPETWDFWRRWWIGARDGKPLDWELQKRVALIPPEEWERNDPAHIARLICEIEEEFHGTALSRATPVDFSFDSLARVMRMVGIDDDTAHLRDPAIVQTFLDDCEELRDTFNDFIDFARELGSSPNRAGVLRLAAEKICAELDRTRDKTHIRARHLVRLGNRLEVFSKEERARDDLGDALSKHLDDGIDLLRTVTRRHFGPAYAALAPLAQLSLDHIDQQATLRLLDDMIAYLEALDSNNALIALDPEGVAVFQDMVREANEWRAALAEASSDEFRDLLENRMAESVGATGLAFGRFLERSAAAAGTASKAVDQAVKAKKKVENLKDIVDYVREYLGSFGPPPS